jgi:RNA recognition motif-containing protein
MKKYMEKALNHFLKKIDGCKGKNMREKLVREGVGKGKYGEGSSGAKGYLHRLEQVATSFFFTNFPKEVKEADLWKRFAHFGRVGDVYIPKKVNKQGRRFGFVKYRDLKDAVEATELLRCIYDIWFGSFKLRVNRSKFERAIPKEDQPSSQRAEKGVVVAEKGVVIAEKSFKGALNGVNHLEGKRTSGVVTVLTEQIPTQQQQVVWEVEVEDEVLAKL